MKLFSYFRDLPTTETHLNISRMETVGKETFRRESPKVLAIVYIITVVSVGFLLIWTIFKKRRKGKVIDITSLLYIHF